MREYLTSLRIAIATAIAQAGSEAVVLSISAIAGDAIAQETAFRPEMLLQRAFPGQRKDFPSLGKDFFALLVTAIYLLTKMSVEF